MTVIFPSSVSFRCCHCFKQFLNSVCPLSCSLKFEEDSISDCRDQTSAIRQIREIISQAQRVKIQIYIINGRHFLEKAPILAGTKSDCGSLAEILC